LSAKAISDKQDSAHGIRGHAFSRTWLTRALSKPFLVKCGEASYSLYLLHYTTLHEWAVPYAMGASMFRRVLIFLIGVLASIAISFVVFLLYERPALRWLRWRLQPAAGGARRHGPRVGTRRGGSQ
jgi:peptidoglycan/LPS O-acetylase OafA/YrhL